MENDTFGVNCLTAGGMRGVFLGFGDRGSVRHMKPIPSYHRERGMSIDCTILALGYLGTELSLILGE